MNAILDILPSNETVPTLITADDVKTRLELDGTYHDDFINDLIGTAVIYAEKYLNRSLIKRDMTVLLQNDEGGQLLPLGPAADSTITVKDLDGNALNSTTEGKGDFRYLKTPLGGPFSVSYTSNGYTAATLPKTIKSGLIQAVVYWFENRGDVGTLPTLAKNTMRYDRIKDNLLFW